MIIEEAPRRALAIFAHPDDPEVACAGTLATWIDAGCETRLVIANAGEKGSNDSSTDPAALARTRRAEAEAAAAVLGVSRVDFLEVPDGELANSSALRTSLIGVVRDSRPDVVIAPDPTAVFFGDGYVNHHDHRELGWAVLDVTGSMAGGALYAPGTGTPHQVEMVLLAGTLEPDAWIDIESSLDRKRAALRCHRSQLGDDDLVDAVVDARAAEVGREAGLRYAEGFRRLVFRGRAA